MRILLNSYAHANLNSSDACERCQLKRTTVGIPVSVQHSNGNRVTLKSKPENVMLNCQNNGVTVCCIEVLVLNYNVICGKLSYQQTNLTID